MAKLSQMAGVTRRNLYAIDPALIEANPADNSRRFPSPQPLDDLVHSLLEEGQLEPCRIRRMPDGSLRLTIGFRRYDAIRQINAAGLAPVKLPVICDIVDATDERAFSMCLAENIQRDGLSVIDLAYSIDRLHREFQRSFGDIAKRMGKSAGWVSQTRRLLELPREIQLAVHRGEMSASAAYETLGLPVEQQKLAAQRVRAQAKAAKSAAETEAESAEPEPEQEQEVPAPRSKPTVTRQEVRRAKRGEEIAESAATAKTRKEIVRFWTEISESAVEDEQELASLAKEVIRWTEGRITDRQLINRLLKALGG